MTIAEHRTRCLACSDRYGVEEADGSGRHATRWFFRVATRNPSCPTASQRPFHALVRIILALHALRHGHPYGR